MGEEKRRRKTHEAVLRKCPNCVYCGGANRANTIEHMPPRAIFKGKNRPKGLEFSSCQKCNEGSKYADLTASLISRIYPDPATELELEEFQRLLKALKNNVPGLLDEMRVGRGGQKIAKKRLPFGLEGGLIRVDGPLVSRYMEAFAAKVGFTFHFESTGEILPTEGGVFARWFTNLEIFDGKIPDDIADLLPPHSTLKQGKKEVADQFGYSMRTASDGSVGAYFARFREAFAVLAIASTDREKLNRRSPYSKLVWAPGDIASRLQQTT